MAAAEGGAVGQTAADKRESRREKKAMSEWEALRQECLHCRACTLAETRTNVVFGVGREDAEVMFIGEAPGANEDMQGEPFVGRGGKLLCFLQPIDTHIQTACPIFMCDLLMINFIRQGFQLQKVLRCLAGVLRKVVLQCDFYNAVCETVDNALAEFI